MHQRDLPSPQLRSRRRGRLLAALTAAVLLIASAAASGLDPRGWSQGTPAANTAAMLHPAAGLPDAITLPKAIAKRIRKPTLLFYFAPSCPHCQRVAPEVAALHDRLGSDAQVIAIASHRSSPEALEAWKRDYPTPYALFTDTDRTVGDVLGAAGTPAAMLVRPEGKKLVPVDAWYPYTPGTEALVRMRLAPTPFAAFAPGEHQGNTACAACHTIEHASWALTHHSVAWRTLVKREAHTRDDCISCHVTGYQQPGGWSAQAHLAMVDVGCESCHGPGGPHSGATVDPTSTCTGCHDDKHSINFHVAKGMPGIDHFRAEGMSPTDWREARRALLDGEVERSLLAFAEGPTAGVQACKSCHPSEVAWWEQSAHGKAMATLERTGSHTDPRCVSCHATPKQIGGEPTATSDYQPDPGVGCESCHGPATDHIASKGAKGTIEGLGDSCPVCVIESVCTSCHNSTWDPKWRLEDKLPRVRHTLP